MLELIAFIREEFPEAIVNISDDLNYADVFIDCLIDKNFEITLDIRTFGVRVEKMDKNLLLGDFSSFEVTFSNNEDAKNFLISCKRTGKFEI